MDKRENLLWQMILTVAFIAIAYVGYSLYFDNDGYLQLLDDFESEEIGTDRQLKEKVQKLEISLKEKQDFITDGSETKYYIAPEDNPSNLLSVIKLEGFESMANQHLKIDNIRYSKRYKGYKATLINSYGDIVFNLSLNDTISGGKIVDIGSDFVVFEKDNERFTYDMYNEEGQ